MLLCSILLHCIFYTVFISYTSSNFSWHLRCVAITSSFVLMATCLNHDLNDLSDSTNLFKAMRGVFATHIYSIASGDYLSEPGF